VITLAILDRMHPGQLVQHYLMASYCYYQLNQSPLHDHVFDRLCVRLLGVLDQITDHQHAHLVHEDALHMGSCLLHEKDFPRMVVMACDRYESLCQSGQMATMLEPHLMPVPAARHVVRRMARAAPTPAAPVTPAKPPRIVRGAPKPADAKVDTRVRAVRRVTR
jgi:hypothetical protein